MYYHICNCIVFIDSVVAELMRDGVYGGNDSIVAFARFYDCTVVIHQPNSPQWEVQGCMNPTQAIKRRRFHIAYLNGEHYCSVVPIDDHPLTESSAASDIGSSTHHTTDEVNCTHTCICNACVCTIIS